jgi:hypothetical protein
LALPKHYNRLEKLARSKRSGLLGAFVNYSRILIVFMLCVVTLSVRCADCHYVERRYAECRYAECYYAECHHAECHQAPKIRLRRIGKCRAKGEQTQHFQLRSLLVGGMERFIVEIKFFNNYSFLKKTNRMNAHCNSGSQRNKTFSFVI